MKTVISEDPSFTGQADERPPRADEDGFLPRMKPIFLYRPPYDVMAHTDFQTTRNVIGAGVRNVVISPMNTANSFGAPYTDFPAIWQWFGLYDFSILDRQIREILDIDKRVRLILVIDLNSPHWLARRLMVDSFYNLSECALNQDWENAVTGYMDAFIEYCETHYAKETAGYVLACGRTLEWIDGGVVSPGMLKCIAYEKWCSDHGFEYRLPRFSDYFESEHGFLRDPQNEADKIRWLRFCNELTCDLAGRFISHAREKIHNDAKIGMFFGHTMYASANGQNDCERIFRKTPPDFVIGAACNTEQTIGSNGGTNVAEMMLRRYGIQFLYECDRLTTTSNLHPTPVIDLENKKHWVRWKSKAADIAGMKREIGMALIHSYSFWAFNIWGESYRDQAIVDILGKGAEIFERYASDRRKTASEILFVADPESNYYVSACCPVTPNILGWQLRGKLLPESGMPFDTADFDDLYTLDLSQYKLIIYQNFFVSSDEREKMLKERVFRDGRTVLFLYAAGVIRNDEWHPENAEKLCGFPHAEKGFFRKEFPDWTSCYLADVEQLMTSGYLNSFFKGCPLHRYTENAAVQAAEDLLQVHTSGTAGMKQILLKKKCRRITELFTGKTVAENTGVFEDHFETVDTKLYLLEPAE